MRILLLNKFLDSLVFITEKIRDLHTHLILNNSLSKKDLKILSKNKKFQKGALQNNVLLLRVLQQTAKKLLCDVDEVNLLRYRHWQKRSFLRELNTRPMPYESTALPLS